MIDRSPIARELPTPSGCATLSMPYKSKPQQDTPDINNNNNTNGTRSFVGGIVLGLTFLAAVATGSFVMGMHMGDGSIHEDSSDKNTRIHTVIDREIRPQLDRIESDIQAMNVELKAIRNRSD